MTVLTLLSLPENYAVAQLPSDAAIPEWATRGPFYSITRSADELSIVSRDEDVPAGLAAERGWRCLRIAGTFDLAMVDILTSVINPLSEAGVAMFVVSTFDTDYVLVREMEFERAADALASAGHRVISGPPPARS
jgi:hypothetical protein